MGDVVEGESALRWRRAALVALATVLLTIGCVVGGRLIESGSSAAAVDSSVPSTSAPVRPVEPTPKQCIAEVLDRLAAVAPKSVGRSTYEVDVPSVADGCKRAVLCSDGGGSLRVLVGTQGERGCDRGRRVANGPDPVAERDESSTTSTTAQNPGADASGAGRAGVGTDSVPSSEAPRRRSSSVTGGGTVTGSTGGG